MFKEIYIFTLKLYTYIHIHIIFIRPSHPQIQTHHLTIITLLYPFTQHLISNLIKLLLST
jgi:hypothetical protein